MAQKVVFAGSVEITVAESGLTPAQAFVRYALSIGALKFEPEYPRKWFQTKIGRRSPYFFNSGLFNTAKCLEVLAVAFGEAIEARYEEAELPDVIYGPAYKGIQIATVVAGSLALGYEDYNPGVAYNRKEVKDHGEGGLLVGVDMRGAGQARPARRRCHHQWRIQARSAGFHPACRWDSHRLHHRLRPSRDW